MTSGLVRGGTLPRTHHATGTMQPQRSLRTPATRGRRCRQPPGRPHLQSDMLGRPRARIPNRRSVSFRMHRCAIRPYSGYLASRGIVPGIAAAYCREVRYQVRNHCFFAIGFRNDCGGWGAAVRTLQGKLFAQTDNDRRSPVRQGDCL